MALCTFSSPFVKYLDTNYIPSRMDRRQIQSLLSEPESQLAQLNSEVSQLQAALDAMTQERNALQQTIDEHYHLLAPMRGLPDDLLREIFLHCLPTDHNCIMSASDAPLVLGRVCRRWRTVLYRTPRVWASIHVPIPSPPPQITTPYPPHLQQDLNAEFNDKVQRHCLFIQEWLQRSGSCPLSISFHPRDSSSGAHNRYIRIYFDVLVLFLSRWRHIEMTVLVGDISTILAKLNAADLPMLSAIDLKFVRRSPHDPAWNQSGLLTASGLRSLRLCHFPVRLSSLTINWSEITHLVIADSFTYARYKRFTVQETVTLFRQCKRLIKCSFDVLDTPDTASVVPDLESTISLPHLTTLSIVDGAATLSSLFECLDVPSLKGITYHTMFYPTSARQSPLLTLLSATGGRIERLTTDIQFYTHQDFVEVLSLVPNLTEFVNKKSRFGVSREQGGNRSPMPLRFHEVLLRLLSPSPPPPMGEDETESLFGYYCRKLEVIRIKEAMHLDDSSVVRFVHARMAAHFQEYRRPTVAKLRKVEISFSREEELHEDEDGQVKAGGGVKAELDRYKDCGVEFSLTYFPPRRRVVNNFSPWNGLNQWGL